MGSPLNSRQKFRVHLQANRGVQGNATFAGSSASLLRGIKGLNFCLVLRNYRLNQQKLELASGWIARRIPQSDASPSGTAYGPVTKGTKDLRPKASRAPGCLRQDVVDHTTGKIRAVGHASIDIALPVRADRVPQLPDSPSAPRIMVIYLLIGTLVNTRIWRHRPNLQR